MPQSASQLPLEVFLRATEGGVDLLQASLAFEAQVPSHARFQVALASFLPFIQKQEDTPSYAHTAPQPPPAQVAAVAYLLVFLYRDYPCSLNPFDPAITLWLRANSQPDCFEALSRVQQVRLLRESQSSLPDSTERQVSRAGATSAAIDCVVDV